MVPPWGGMGASASSFFNLIFIQTPRIWRIVMPTLRCFKGHFVYYLGVAISAFALVTGMCPSLFAQTLSTRSAVGGISVDANGLLENAEVDQLGELSRIRSRALEPIPGNLNQATPLRKVSLRRLEEAIKKYIEDGKELPDSVKYLAGLQGIRYIFVDPERKDIVLAGPGEGWTVDASGNVVGVTTGRPVMFLDDLLVALRTAGKTVQSGISCSIDPTPEGLTRLRAHVNKLKTIGNPSMTAAGIEDVLGMQQISVVGVPETSRFARVLVAADYRMKRLAMNFDPPPVSGLPSFLQMMKASGSGMRNMLPRWWLMPSYDPLLRDADGLAWELRGASVKAMTEEDFLAADGTRRHTGRASGVAQKWANNMTSKYSELAIADPIFGELQNCMELAVVAALIVKEDLSQKAGSSMPLLLDPTDVDIANFPAPKQVDSKASVLKKGRKWIISASGGVLVDSWAIVEKVKQDNSLDKVRTKAIADESTNWWWN